MIGKRKKFNSLSDSAKNFVMLHEKGHVLAGHKGGRNFNQEAQADMYAANVMGKGQAKSALTELNAKNSNDYELKLRSGMKFATNNDDFSNVYNQFMKDTYNQVQASKGHNPLESAMNKTKEFFFGKDRNRASITDALGHNIGLVSRKLVESLFGAEYSYKLDIVDETGRVIGTARLS